MYLFKKGHGLKKVADMAVDDMPVDDQDDDEMTYPVSYHKKVLVNKIKDTVELSLIHISEPTRPY